MGEREGMASTSAAGAPATTVSTDEVDRQEIIKAPVMAEFWHQRDNDQYISHLRFADDIVIMAETLEELGTMLKDLSRVSQLTPVTVITLKPKASRRKKVIWTEDTIDNEDMNKKKSKCCCIYEKPRKFDESDSDESEDDCEHCFGHVEKRKKNAHGGATSTSADAANTTAPTSTTEELIRETDSVIEKTLTITLRASEAEQEQPKPPDDHPDPEPS